jgi:hypothetical protein
MARIYQTKILKIIKTQNTFPFSIHVVYRLLDEEYTRTSPLAHYSNINSDIYFQDSYFEGRVCLVIIPDLDETSQVQNILSSSSEEDVQAKESFSSGLAFLLDTPQEEAPQGSFFIQQLGEFDLSNNSVGLLSQVISPMLETQKTLLQIIQSMVQYSAGAVPELAGLPGAVSQGITNFETTHQEISINLSNLQGNDV